MFLRYANLPDSLNQHPTTGMALQHRPELELLTNMSCGTRHWRAPCARFQPSTSLFLADVFEQCGEIAVAIARRGLLSSRTACPAAGRSSHFVAPLAAAPVRRPGGHGGRKLAGGLVLLHDKWRRADRRRPCRPYRATPRSSHEECRRRIAAANRRECGSSGSAGSGIPSAPCRKLSRPPDHRRTNPRHSRPDRPTPAFPRLNVVSSHTPDSCSGSSRKRCPVRAYTALATAGAVGGTPASPMPPVCAAGHDVHLDHRHFVSRSKIIG